jgi:hypothetical protein
VERREAFRYPLRLTAIFTWQSENRISHTTEGVIRDVSTKGVFVNAVVTPREEAAIRIEFDFPPVREGADLFRICVDGHVVRVDRDEANPTHSGFAAISDVRSCTTAKEKSQVSNTPKGFEAMAKKKQRRKTSDSKDTRLSRCKDGSFNANARAGRSSDL